VFDSYSQTYPNGPRGRAVTIKLGSVPTQSQKRKQIRTRRPYKTPHRKIQVLCGRFCQMRTNAVSLLKAAEQETGKRETGLHRGQNSVIVETQDAEGFLLDVGENHKCQKKKIKVPKSREGREGPDRASGMEWEDCALHGPPLHGEK